MGEEQVLRLAAHRRATAIIPQSGVVESVYAVQKYRNGWPSIGQPIIVLEMVFRGCEACSAAYWFSISSVCSRSVSKFSAPPQG